jgi:hypothetical protein
VFEVTTAVVPKILGKRPENLRRPGRPQVFDPDVGSGIVTLLLEAFTHGRAVTLRELPQTAHTGANPKLIKGSVNSFIERNPKAVELYRWHSQETHA